MAITIRQRAMAIKPGSSMYNYYMNTPLDELNSKEEKLLKQELRLLQEDAPAAELEPVEPEVAENVPVEDEGSALGTAVKVAGGVAAGAAATYVGVLAYFMKWKDGILTILDKDSTYDVKTDAAEANSRIWSSLGQFWTDKIMPTLKTAGATISMYTIEPCLKFINFLTDKVVEIFEKMGLLAAESSDTRDAVANTTRTTIGVAIVIVATYCIWKIVKFFIRDNGEVKDQGELAANAENPEEINNSLETDLESENKIPVTAYGNPFSESFNPMYNNLALAILCEVEEDIAEASNDDGKEAVDALESESTPFIMSKADVMVEKLVSDPKFEAVTAKASPEMLEEFKKYQNRDKSGDKELEESIKQKIQSNAKALNEEDAAILPAEGEDANGSTTSLFDKIINGFKSIGKASANSVSYVKDKIIQFKNAYSNSPNMLVRWMPAAVESAIAVLAIYYLWNNEKLSDPAKATAIGATVAAGGLGAKSLTPDKPEEQNNPIEESKMDLILKQYMSALSLMTEVASKLPDEKEKKKPAIKAEKVLEGLSGTGEKLGNNLMIRAKSVSTDLLDDSEFIAFSKKYIPEALPVVKKINKCENCCSKADKK